MKLRNLALAFALASSLSIAQDARKTDDKAPSTYIKLDKKDTTKK